MRKKSTGYGTGVKDTGSAKGCRGEGAGSVMDRKEEGSGSAMVLILLFYLQVPTP